MIETEENLKVSNRLSQPIESLSIDKDELKKICAILQERANAAADIEVKNYKRGVNQTEENYENDKKLLRKAFELKLTVVDKKGKELFGSIENVFDSPNFPDDISSIYINSEIVLKTNYNWIPRNSFELFFDFTKPSVFDFSILPSNKTPNASNFKVQGYDATWCNGVFSEFFELCNSKKSIWSKVHNHSVYDILLLLIGIPLGFWMCIKITNIITALQINPFLINALYVYVFMFALWLFRVLFHYIRWVAPLVEFKNKNSQVGKHRVFIVTILTGVVAAVVYDFIKFLKRI